MKVSWKLFIIAMALLFCLCAGSDAKPGFPFPQHLTYSEGAIFPNHRSRDQLDEDVCAAYLKWKGRYLETAGEEADGQHRFRVKVGTSGSERTVSEGQGYGMVIVAYMAGFDPEAQNIFNGLWEFFNDHRSVNDQRLMDWSVPADEHSDGNSDGSAFDGDCDIAFALLLADQQWGSSARINYRHEAEAVLAGMMKKEIGPESRLPLLGDWVDPKAAQYNQHTVRTSDFIPDHFRAFERVTGQDAWGKVVVSTQTVLTALQMNYSLEAGLFPDFVEPRSPADYTPRPADPGFLEGPHDGDYYYNAGRMPWRIGIDALLNDDTTSREQVRRLSLWAQKVTDNDPGKFLAGYKLDGTPLNNSNYFTTFFVAPLGVAAMNLPSQQKWLNDIYEAVYDKVENYYSDTVTLLCLIAMTGNYWDPSRIDMGRTDELTNDGSGSDGGCFIDTVVKDAWF